MSTRMDNEAPDAAPPVPQAPDEAAPAGESDEQWGARIDLLLPYRVTEKVLHVSGKPDTKFLHCLPAVHDRSTQLGERLHELYGISGAEVTDDVFESPHSIVFDQAEKRLHTIKAVLVTALGD